MKVKEDILENDLYKYLFSVEQVNKLALSGVPFREAYKQVGLMIEAGQFNPEKKVQHTHEGSIGNLCNDKVVAMMDKEMSEFKFWDEQSLIG
jgi:argininosuccinate lyase